VSTEFVFIIAKSHATTLTENRFTLLESFVALVFQRSHSPSEFIMTNARKFYIKIVVKNLDKKGPEPRTERDKTIV
jgi:hypothetical protein